MANSKPDILINQLKYGWFVFIMKLTGLLPDWQPIMRLRGLLIRPLLKQCGRNFQICSQSVVINIQNLCVGNDVYIAHGCWIGASGGIVLEDEVMLGPYTVMVTGNHTLNNGSYRFGRAERRPIFIGRGSWMGAGTKVMPGVQIGEGVLCAAGSVVTRNVPDNAIVAGVPARELTENKTKQHCQGD